jgi:alpha-N-acetylglucosamine transferase
LAVAEEKGMIDWKYGAIDGSFSPWERWRWRYRLWLQRQRCPYPQYYRCQWYASSSNYYPWRVVTKGSKSCRC